MLKFLKKAMKNNSFCQIDLIDGAVLLGFILSADRECFEMEVFEEIGDTEMQMIDLGDGNAMFIASDENKDAIRSIVVHSTEFIASINMDASHKANPELWKTIQFLQKYELKDVKGTLKIVARASQPVTKPKRKPLQKKRPKPVDKTPKPKVL